MPDFYVCHKRQSETGSDEVCSFWLYHDTNQVHEIVEVVHSYSAAVQAKRGTTLVPDFLQHLLLMRDSITLWVFFFIVHCGRDLQLTEEVADKIKRFVHHKSNSNWQSIQADKGSFQWACATNSAQSVNCGSRNFTKYRHLHTIVWRICS